MNCVEISDQSKLCEYLPKLFKDLQQSNIETLNNFRVEWKHLDMNNLVPSTELGKFLLTEMCKDAAEDVRMQCGRKYWSDEGNQRANLQAICDKEETPPH